MGTCSECTYWAPEAAPVKEKDNLGECGKLSFPKMEMNEDLLLPILSGHELKEMAKTEIVTMADFGCNQFSQN